MSVSPDLSVGKVLADTTSAGYTSAGGNRFTKGQCTWYAAGRAFEKKGIKLVPLLPTSGADACKWFAEIATTNSKVTKYPASKGPIVDSIAVFAHGTCGHVVYVEAIRGKYTYFTEYNWNQSQNGKLQKVLTSEFANLHGNCTLLGSITVR
jgi:surface antigen